jgi:hypothetical protein
MLNNAMLNKKTALLIFFCFLNLDYSDLRLFTGFAMAAFIAWMLMVSVAISNVNTPDFRIILFHQWCPGRRRYSKIGFAVRPFSFRS